jgi:hypothetical protein
VRPYSFTELRWLLEGAGFEVRETYGGVSEDDLSLERTRTAVVAERSA